MKTVFVTGFSPFGPYPRNTSGMLAAELSHKVFAGVRIQSWVIGTEIELNRDRGLDILVRAQTAGAVGIIALGMASSVHGFRFEQFAYNRIQCEKYAPPELNGKPIRSNQPYNHKLATGNGELVFHPNRCQASIDMSQVSDDPGGFCCNALMYQMCAAQQIDRKFLDIPWIFAHIPCTKDTVLNPGEHLAQGKLLVTRDQLLSGLETLIKTATF